MVKAKVVKYVILFGIFVLGIVAGGYIFAGVQPRSFLSIHKCEDCLSSKEFIALLASTGIQRLGGNLPLVLQETAWSIAFQHPFPEARIHYVVVPKRDIKDIGEVGEGDEPYLVDAFAVLSELAREDNLTKYKIITNGPGYQSVNYLHFHLLAK